MFNLTTRERELMIALANTAGSDQVVADTMGLSRGTSKIYLTRVRKKLAAQGFDVKSRYNLIAWAKEHQTELEGL